MAFKQLRLSRTTMVGTFVIVSLPSTGKTQFMAGLQQALTAATPPPLQRDSNVISQELFSDETQADVNTCLWSIRFNGIHAADAVREDCLALYEGVREQIEKVGTRTSFRLETLEGAWQVE